MTFTENDTVAVKGYKGVAFYIHSRPQRWEPARVYTTDEEGEEVEIDDPDGEGEWVPDEASGKWIVVMVGDDKRHEVDESDLTPLSEDDYCPGCGQTGCKAYH